MVKKNKQLFDLPEWWEEEWQGMPEFISEDQTPYSSVMVHFESKKDMDRFSELVGQKIYRTTKSIWYPKAKIKVIRDKYYVIDRYNNNKRRKNRDVGKS